MTPEIILTRISMAEKHASEEVFDRPSLRRVVQSLKEVTAPSAIFTVETILRLAAVLRRRGKGLSDNSKDGGHAFKQADEVLRKGLALYADDPDLLKEQRSFYYGTEQYDKAFESWKRVIERDPPADPPDRAEAFENAVACLRELRRFPDAEDMLARASAESTSDTPSVRLLIERAWLRFYQKLYEQASDDFTEVLNRRGAGVSQEDEHEAMAGKIAAYQAVDALNPTDKQNRSAQLLKSWLDQAAISDAEASDILFHVDSIHTLLNLYPAALLNYDLLLGVDSVRIELVATNWKSWWVKIAGLKWLRRFKEAEDLCRRAQSTFPDNITLWREMGYIHHQQKRHREAYAYFSGKALEDPANRAQNHATFRQKLEADEEANEWTVVSLRKMRDLKAARKRVDELLAKRSDKVGFLCEKAAIDYAEQQYANAITLFDRALSLNEYDEFAQQWRAAAYRRTPRMVQAATGSDPTPDFTEASAALAGALSKIPFGTGLWEERAWLAFDQGDLEQAVSDFAESIALDPYMLHRRFSRIEILVRRNETDKAIEAFDKLSGQFPHDAEIAEQRCWFHLRLGQVEQARLQCESIERHHPGHVLGLNARGGYELQQRQYAAAAECFSKAIDKVDHEPQYHINLAWALLRQVKEPGEMKISKLKERDDLLDKARESSLKALALDPYSAKAHSCLGVIAFKRSAYLDAEYYFLKSIKLSPQEGSYVELAALYCQMGRFEEAQSKLKEAVRLNKNDARAYIEWGNVSVLTANNKEAVRLCREAVIAEPMNPETHRALAIALMRNEQYDEAETTIRDALRKVPPARQWQLYLLLSQVSVRLGDLANKDRKKKDLSVYDEALRYVDEARRNNPAPNADIFFHAGIVQYKRSDYQSAQKYFDDCVRANRDRFEADRYGSIVKAFLEQEKRLFHVNVWYGYVLAGICIVLLALLWGLYFSGHRRTILEGAAPAAAAGNAAASGATGEATKREPQDHFTVDSSLLTVMTPILLGLLVVAALLPNLNKLKLPGGFEAEIVEAKTEESDISSGPRGDIGFGSSLPIINPEPR